MNPPNWLNRILHGIYAAAIAIVILVVPNLWATLIVVVLVSVVREFGQWWYLPDRSKWDAWDAFRDFLDFLIGWLVAVVIWRIVR